MSDAKLIEMRDLILSRFYTPYNVLLQCVKTDACEKCVGEWNYLNERLVRGRVYRATHRHLPMGPIHGGWYIPELYELPEIRTVDGREYYSLVHWCPPHFAEINSQHDEEILKMIVSCKHRVPEDT